MDLTSHYSISEDEVVDKDKIFSALDINSSYMKKIYFHTSKYTSIYTFYTQWHKWRLTSTL
jgi:hypothetical protein